MNLRWEQQKIQCELKYERFWKMVWKKGKKPAAIALGLIVFLALSYYVMTPCMVSMLPVEDPIFGAVDGILTPSSIKHPGGLEGWPKELADQRVQDINKTIGLLISGPITFVTLSIWVVIWVFGPIGLFLFGLCWLFTEGPVYFCTWWHLRKKR